MKRIFLWFIPCLLLVLTGCRGVVFTHISRTPSKECNWDSVVTVRLINNYLRLPCEEHCIKEAEYAPLYYYFGDCPTSIMQLIEAVQWHKIDNCMCKWNTTENMEICTAQTRVGSWCCSPKEYSLLGSSGDVFYEVHKPDVNPNSCKYNYELSIVLHSGVKLIWTKEWENISYLEADDRTQSFIVSDYDNPIYPQVIYPQGLSGRYVYVNTEFELL